MKKLHSTYMYRDYSCTIHLPVGVDVAVLQSESHEMEGVVPCDYQCPQEVVQ